MAAVNIPHQFQRSPDHQSARAAATTHRHQHYVPARALTKTLVNCVNRVDRTRLYEIEKMQLHTNCSDNQQYAPVSEPARSPELQK